MKKGFSTVLGVIIVLLIGAVGFVLWQQYASKNVEPQNTQLQRVGGKIESPVASQPTPTPQAVTQTPQPTNFQIHEIIYGNSSNS